MVCHDECNGDDDEEHTQKRTVLHAVSCVTWPRPRRRNHVFAHFPCAECQRSKPQTTQHWTAPSLSEAQSKPSHSEVALMVAVVVRGVATEVQRKVRGGAKERRRGLKRGAHFGGSLMVFSVRFGPAGQMCLVLSLVFEQNYKKASCLGSFLCFYPVVSSMFGAQHLQKRRVVCLSLVRFLGGSGSYVHVCAPPIFERRSTGQSSQATDTEDHTQCVVGALTHSWAPATTACVSSTGDCGVSSGSHTSKRNLIPRLELFICSSLDSKQWRSFAKKELKFLACFTRV